MRITPVSWLIVGFGALVFGGAIIVTARLLPSDETRAKPAIASFDVRPPAQEVPAPTQGPALAEPPLAPVEAPAAGLRVLDHRPVDVGLRDRNGNAPKRDITRDELARIARDYDIVEDDLREQPDGTPLSISEMQEMRRINPRLKILRYVSTLTSNDPAFGTTRPDDGTHSSWFLRDAAGEVVLAYTATAAWNGEPNFVMDPANIDVRNAIAALTHQFMLLGYDGVVLDGLTSRVPILLTAPINPSSGVAYTDAEWGNAVLGLVAAVRRAAPTAVVVVG